MAQTPEDPIIPARQTTYSAPALEKGFNVLELLSRTPQGLTVRDIAAGLNLSISEIFRIIVVMERREWLKKGPDDRYRVTPLMLKIAFRAAPTENLTSVAAPIMRDFAKATDQSCHLVIRSEDKGLIIMRQQNPGPTGFYVRVGSELHLETSCSGRVLLAFAPDQPGQAPVADPKLLESLKAIAQRGYERMESLRTLGVTDVSYPILDFSGDIVAALTMPFLRLIDGTQPVSLDDAQRSLGEAAGRISAELSTR